MTGVSLEDIEITDVEEHPVTESVKLNGPPGTGKTTESAARVAALLEQHDYELGDVLWATYRKSLAAETLERLAKWGVIDEKELSDPYKGPTRFIGTVHAVGNRLVDGVGDTVGYSEKKEFAAERGLRYDSRSPWDEPPGQTLFDVFDYAANNLIDIHDPAEREEIPQLEQLKDDFRGDIGRAWDAWTAYKREEDVSDFWEQLAEPLRQGVTPSHDIVVIDEFHDAYPLMAKLASTWIEAADVAIVAGDPLQVVNTYAGASPSYFHNLDLPEVELPTAWERPPREHWSVATQLLANAHTPPDVKIDNRGSFREASSPTFDHQSDNGWTLPDADRARSPAWMVREFGTDTMFLTRTQKQATGIARALEKAGVLYETQNSMNIEGWGARDDMSERTALYNALQKAKSLSPGDSDGHGLTRYDEGREDSKDEVVLRAREAAALLDHAGAEWLDGSRAAVTEHANQLEADGTPVTAADIEPYTKPEFWGVYNHGAGAVRRLNKTASRAEGTALKKTDFEALRQALAHNDEPVMSVDTKVYTIHASKGSEAKNVVVYDGITNRIRENMDESERERKNEFRTWYVALTRSRANLFVLRDGFPWMQSFLPSNLLDAAKTAANHGVEA